MSATENDLRRAVKAIAESEDADLTEFDTDRLLAEVRELTVAIGEVDAMRRRRVRAMIVLRDPDRGDEKAFRRVVAEAAAMTPGGVKLAIDYYVAKSL
jgi:hypothetical protein